MGTDTEFGRPGFSPRLTCRSAGQAVQASCNAQMWGQAPCRVYPIWGQARCPAYRSGTFNVQRSTLNFQRGDRKGGWWAGYGERHAVWATGVLRRRRSPAAGRMVEAGCGAQIWGQARCPAYRSGTFNVQRLTLNVQRGDRMGGWWAGYGDRHDVGDTDQESLTSNVQLSTFNGVTERAHGGRDMGTDT